MSPPDEQSPVADVAALAHELRTPLNAILGYAEAMREELLGPLDQRYRAAAQAIHQGARHMHELIERIGAPGGRARPSARLDLQATVAEVIGLLETQAKAKGVELAVETSGVGLTVEADALALRQLLINLLTNAVAATPPGGHVELRAEASDSALTIAVADSGPGPDASLVEGVGLRLVRQICADHGGEFKLVRASVGGGLASARLPILAAE